MQYLVPTMVEDPYSGESREDWDHPVVILGQRGDLLAGVEDYQADEPVEVGRTRSVSRRRIYHDVALAISERWRVKVRGEVMLIEGRPGVWRNPLSGRTCGTVVEARWTVG